MPVILGANSASGGYNITNSLRFNSGSSDNLSKTFGTATSRRIYTISTWVKRSNLGTVQNIFTAGISGTGDAGLRFPGSGDELSFYEISSPYSAYNFSIVTNQVFRDVSAWYHIVVAVDTTQATSSNRIKLYVNGSQITSLSSSSYPSQNYDGYINNNITHRISGAVDTTFGTRYFDGYLSEFYFIDGQALTPTSFGETDEDTGIWKPKAYTGTFGTNGFYLDFEDSANLGNDMSGNNNDFTVNNLTSIDQTTDTPTNNFCTLNPLIRGSQIITGVNDLIFTEGNLVGSCDATVNRIGGSTFGVSKGKWYFEAKAGTGVGSGTGDSIGWFPNAVNSERGYRSSGDKMYDGATQTAYGATFSAGDIIGCAFDIDGGTMTFYKNGTSQGTAFTGITTNDVWIPMCYARNNSMQMNFGSPMYSANSYSDGAGYGNFSYSVPSGYYSLCTKNLYQYGF